MRHLDVDPRMTQTRKRHAANFMVIEQQRHLVDRVVPIDRRRTPIVFVSGERLASRFEFSIVEELELVRDETPGAAVRAAILRWAQAQHSPLLFPSCKSTLCIAFVVFALPSSSLATTHIVCAKATRCRRTFWSRVHSLDQAVPCHRRVNSAPTIRIACHAGIGSGECLDIVGLRQRRRNISGIKHPHALGKHSGIVSSGPTLLSSTKLPARLYRLGVQIDPCHSATIHRPMRLLQVAGLVGLVFFNFASRRSGERDLYPSTHLMYLAVVINQRWLFGIPIDNVPDQAEQDFMGLNTFSFNYVAIKRHH